MFKVEQQSQMETCDRKVSDHLSHVSVSETISDFGIHNDLLVDDQIRNQTSDQLAVILNGKILLLVHSMSAFP